jgi:hypothetical protein
MARNLTRLRQETFPESAKFDVDTTIDDQVQLGALNMSISPAAQNAGVISASAIVADFL